MVGVMTFLLYATYTYVFMYTSLVLIVPGARPFFDFDNQFPYLVTHSYADGCRPHKIAWSKYSFTAREAFFCVTGFCLAC